jgi:hypothetical protein
MNSKDDNKIESKLAQFRDNKRRIDSSKTTHSSIKILNIFDSIRKRITSQSKSSESKSDSTNQMSVNNSHKMELNESQNEPLLSDESVFPIDDEEEEETTHFSKTDIIVIIIKILIYVLLQIIAIAIEFGAVFFSIALLFFICTNLRNRKKKRGELSYVFQIN